MEREKKKINRHKRRMGKDGPEWRERKIYGKRMKEKNERKE